MTLELEEIIKFGLYKGKKIEEILMIDPQYIAWLIGNIPDISVPPFFIEEAVKINPFFSIPDKYLDDLHHRIQNYLSIFENDFEDFMKNKEYLKYLNISMEEKKPYLEIYHRKTKEMAEKNLNDFFKKNLR